MKRSISFICLILWVLLLSSYSDEGDFPVLKGPYFGQNPPGLKAELFAPGIVSTGLHDDGAPVFTRDGKEVFWRIWGLPHAIIAHRQMVAGIWQEPEVASLSGQYGDSSLALSPDGKRLYFGSRRPVAENDKKPDSNIWFVDKTENGWSEPKCLGEPVNSEFNEGPASIAVDGSLYMTRAITYSGKPADYGLYCAEFKDGIYKEPVKLPPPFNSGKLELMPVISPDGTYIVYSIRNGEGGLGSDDLYVTFKKKNGSWSNPINLGDNVNSPSSDWGPSFSPDGKYMFFISWRSMKRGNTPEKKTFRQWLDIYNSPGNGNGADIYWVDTKVIMDLKANN